MLPWAAAGVACAVIKLKMGRPHFPKKDGPYAVPEGPEPGAAYKNVDFPGPLRSEPFPNCDTVYAVFQYALKRNGSRRAVGTRVLHKVDTEKDKDGREVEKLHLGEYTWNTYQQLGSRVEDVAAGLVKFCDLKSKDKVIIYAETKAEWMVAAQSCFRQNAIVVTIYATLGEDGVSFGINQTRAPIIVCDNKLLKTVVKVLPQCPHLKFIVTIGDVDAALVAKIAQSRPEIKVTKMDDLAKTGSASPVQPQPPSANDTAVIMYTSGTTGNPKGVVIFHSNVCASMTGLRDASKFTNKDVYLAYLPLAHIMELAAESVMFALGCAVGYGSPQTLSDTGLKLAAGSRGDAPTLKPTFMVFAPTVLDRVRQGVQAKVKAAKPIAQKLFGKALAAGARDFDKGLIGAPTLWNFLVFRKIQALLGGKIKLMISGSAPLSLETQKFIQTVFNCPVRQGYGLTETCSAATVGAFDDNTWSAGRPLSSCKIKLVDWEEGNYLNADAANPDIRMPRGEVLIGGPCIAQGYYIDPESPDAELVAKNASDFSQAADGTRYFHTGDVGQFTASGMLQIIDRKKDLVKLQMGEYVALSKVENALKLSPYVEQCMAYALSSKSTVVALVIPAEKAVMPWAEANGLGGKTFAQLCAEPTLNAEIMTSIKAAGKSGRLAGFEVPVAIALLSELWTPENDMVTAAMKMKRQNIVAANKAAIDKIYA